jgi:uncharacterized protein YjiS (DUF1127 family)
MMSRPTVGFSKIDILKPGAQKRLPREISMFKLTSFRNDGAFWPFTDRSQIDQRPHSLIGVVMATSWRAMIAIGREIAARRAMRTLSSLDERMLRDIGIERDQIGYVARQGRRAMRAQDARADIVRWS